MSSSTTLKYAMWSMGERYVPVALQIVSTLILTRMILPSDFAEVALISAIIELLTLLIASGLSDGLIYKNKNSELLYSTVFYTNLGVAIVLYLLLIASAESISEFYEIPRLQLLIYFAGLNMIFYALSYIHRAIYTINLNFKTPAKITFLSTIIGCAVGITLAFNGFGVWAIVFQTLTINASQSVLFWLKNKWRPVLEFSWEELKTILSFSIRVFLNNLIQSIYDNIYTLLLGKFQSAKSLGYYNRMQSVVFFSTTNLSYSLQHVYYPMLSRVKDDFEALSQKYLQISRIITYVSFPLLVILIGCGHDIILLILTENWVDGTDVLQLLCVAFFFIPAIYINNTYMKLLNQTTTLFYAGILRKVIGISILFVTITTNMTYILYGIILTFLIEWLITSICVQKYLEINVIKQVVNILPTILLNAFVLVAIFYMNNLIESIYLRLSICILVSAVSYTMWPILMKTKEYFDIKTILRK